MQLALFFTRKLVYNKKNITTQKWGLTITLKSVPFQSKKASANICYFMV